MNTQDLQAPRIISMWEHSGWGDSVSWCSFEKRRVTGHISPLPQMGDILHSKMESGKTAQFRFEKIEPCTDPSDMFFATVSDLDYL